MAQKNLSRRGSRPLLQRLVDQARPEIEFIIDGEGLTARSGDTVLTAILTNTAYLRSSEFGGGARAGFCLIGACQDCWVRLAQGQRVRACTTLATNGMHVLIDT